MNSGKNAHHLCTTPFNAVHAVSFFIMLFLLFPFGGRAQDAWTGLGSPPGAMIQDVARIGGTIVAETRIGDTGMDMRYWRSDDAGQSWTAFALQERGDLFVAHGYVWLLTSPRGQLFRADPVSGWLEVPTNLQTTSPGEATVVGDTVYVPVRDRSPGLMRSIDPTLQDWVSVTGGLPDDRVLCIGGAEGGAGAALLCAVEDRGVYRRTANGAWVLLSDSLPAQSLRRIVHASTGYLAHDGHSLYHSADGITWTALSTGTDRAILDLETDGGDLALVATGAGLLLSSNGGRNWRPETLQLSSICASAIDVAPGQLLMGTMPYGLFVSTDSGGAWTQLPLFAFVPIDEVVEHGTDLVFGSKSFAPHRFRRSGDQWSRMFLPIDGWDPWEFTRSRMYSHRRTLYYRTSDGLSQETHAWRSLDDGVTWLSCDSVPVNWRLTAASDPSRFYSLTPDGIARTEDDGETWQYRSTHLYPVHIAATAGHLYVASSCALRHSTDGGDTWLADTLGTLGYEIDELLVSDSLVCIRTLNITLVRSHGDSVFQSIGNAPPGPCFLNGGLLLCDNGGTFFRLDLDSAVWVQWTEGEPATGTLRLIGTAGSLLLALDSRGASWSRTLAKTTGSTGLPPMADVMTVDVWPHPATDRLSLRLHGGTGPATVTVSDMLGRRWISRSGEEDRIFLDTSTLPRGGFLLTVMNAGRILQRMVILK